MTAEEIIHMLQNKAREHLEKAYMLEHGAEEWRRTSRYGNMHRKATLHRASFSLLSNMADEIQAELIRKEIKS